MRLHPLITVLALGVLALPGMALYADVPLTAAPATANPPAPAATQSGKGTITKVDGTTVEIRVTDDKGKNSVTLVLTVTPATKITRAKASATISDLKAGDSANFSETPGSDPSAGAALTIDAGKPKTGKNKKGQTTN